MVRGDHATGVHAKYEQTDSCGNRLAAFGGDNRDHRSFAYWSALWLGEALWATKLGGVLAVFTDWRQLPYDHRRHPAGGWVWRGIVPWHKPNGRRTQGRCRPRMKKALASAMSAHLGTAAQLEQVDADKGTDGVKSMLGGLAVALGIRTSHVEM